MYKIQINMVNCFTRFNVVIIKSRGFLPRASRNGRTAGKIIEFPAILLNQCRVGNGHTDSPRCNIITDFDRRN